MMVRLHEFVHDLLVNIECLAIRQIRVDTGEKHGAGMWRRMRRAGSHKTRSWPMQRCTVC